MIDHDLRWYDDARHHPATTRVALDGITMVGTYPGRSGYGILDMDGWVAGSPMEGGARTYEDADGGVQGPVWRRPREITISGTIHGYTQADLQRKMEQLGAILTRTRWSDMVVTEPWLGLARKVTVRLARMTGPTPRPDRLTAVFTLALEADSDVRVSRDMRTLTLSTGQSTTITNAGTYPARLYAMLYGPLTNPSVTIAGKQWLYQGSLAVGESMGVDFDRRYLRDPAQRKERSRRQAFGAWPSLAPGEQSAQAGGTGTGRIELRWWDTWS